jgi:hypothetical protein
MLSMIKQAPISRSHTVAESFQHRVDVRSRM